jgi:heptosyltransferase-2
MMPTPLAGLPRPTLVRLRNWVGDAILGVPALRLLQAHGHDLTLVGKPWAQTLLAGEGWPVLKRPAKLGERVAQLRQWRLEAQRADPGLKRRDNALVLPTAFSAALETRLAGLRAVGYEAEGRSLLLRRAVPPLPRPRHELRAYWHLACHFLGVQAEPPASIDLATHPADQADADALLQQRGVQGPFVVVCPFAGGLIGTEEKTWPRFAEFTRQLLKAHYTVLACPGPGEDAIISEEHPGVLLLPGVKMGVYGGLLRRAAMVVSNDTGPGHLAAAVGAPLISVLGPTLPEQWGPWGPSVKVVRRWPGWPGVDETLAAFESHLARPR